MDGERPKPGSLEYEILITFLDQEKPKKPKEIADILEKKASTINSALKRMQEGGILHWHHYGKVEILNNGKEILKDIKRHLEHIETFLMESLNITKKEAESESKRLAPHFSCDIIDKICDKYNCHVNGHN
ncbi:MAG: hypothetical protein GY870_03835 [archaeon]|nr:hypothetical protein [archaeon]